MRKLDDTNAAEHTSRKKSSKRLHVAIFPVQLQKRLPGLILPKTTTSIFIEFTHPDSMTSSPSNNIVQRNRNLRRTILSPRPDKRSISMQQNPKYITNQQSTWASSPFYPIWMGSQREPVTKALSESWEYQMV